MVGVKWLFRCDVFTSQVADISVHSDAGKGEFPHWPRFKDTEFKAALINILTVDHTTTI